MSEIQADGAKDRHDRGHDHHAVGHRLPLWANLLQAVALVLLLGLSASWLVIMSSLPRIEGRHPVAGLQSGANIARDSLGVPRIAGKTVADAYFALGWVHAQDRLWQMEVQRRIGAGRLAEAVGEAGLANDRFMRTLGLYDLARRDFEQLDPATREVLTAYVRGINSWMAEYGRRLPPEFTVLGLAPEPWTPADCLVWQKLMALQLAGDWQSGLVRARLARLLDPKRMKEFFPDYPPDAPVTLAQGHPEALLAALPDTARTTAASNVWVVAGSRTASGKPLLANDPHLGLRAPIQWYLASVEAPGLSLTGATVPGVPFHIIAQNGRIAWGITATQADTMDLFVEKLVGTESYKTPDGPRPFLTRQETIKVKGAPDDVILTVRQTRHGPVISDLAAGQGVAGPDEVIALSATLLSGPDLTSQALYKINQAGNWQSFTAALRDFQAPVLNLAYADTAGNTGFITAGRIPIRKSGRGALPSKGWTGEGDWIGQIPFAKLPQAYNPKSGLLVNANNKVVDDRYPYLITANWGDGYRAQRIRDMLDAAGPGLTPESMSAIQGDNLSLPVMEMKELLTSHDYPSKPAAEAARLLAAWDARARADGPEALIWAAWIARLNRAIIADEIKDLYPAMATPRPAFLLAVLTRYRHWCDDVTTPEAESCEDLMERSLDQALTDLAATWGPDPAKWSWGAAHRARLDNAVLDQVPGLKRLADLDVPTGGDDFTVSRGTYRPDAAGTHFDHVHGAGLRAVFDLSNLEASRFVLATGQSGNPLSRHYGDMVEPWRANRLIWPQPDSPLSVLRLEPTR